MKPGKKVVSMKRKMFVLLVGMLVAGLLLASCSDSSSANGNPDGDFTQVCSIDEECEVGLCCLQSICQPCTDGDLVVPDYDGDNFVDGDQIADGDDDWSIPTAKERLIFIDPEEVNFGSVQINGLVTKSFSIRNVSNEDINLTIYSVSYNDTLQTAEFSLTNLENYDFPVVLLREQSMSIEITYAPTDTGIDTGVVDIVSDASNEPLAHVQLVSRYKGTKFIEVSPLHHDFGGLDLGSTPVEQEFVIKNIGEPSGNKVLTISDIRLASGFENDNFSIISGEIDRLNPVQLTPFQADIQLPIHTFTVRYSPQTKANIFSPHSERILIVNDSDDITEQIKNVTVEGWAESSLLSVIPFPIEFGTVIIHDHECLPPDTCNPDYGTCCPNGQVCLEVSGEHQCYKQKDVQIANWSDNPVALKELRLSPRGECPVFRIDDYNGIAGQLCDTVDDCAANMTCEPIAGESEDLKFCHVDQGSDKLVNFRMTYKPVEVVTDTCNLQIFSTLPGADVMNFEVTGKGRLPNVAPVPRLALQSHGPIIVEPIWGIEEDTTLCFYGDVSYDEDGEIIPPGVWSMPVMPAGSSAYFRYLDNDQFSSCVKFDKAGDYEIHFTVSDDEGAWGDPFRVYVTVNGQQGLSIVLRFERGDNSFFGNNLVDMDLGMISPSGFKCSDDTIMNTGTCVFGLGEGVVTMPTVCTGGGTCNGVEEMRGLNMVDGAYKIEVTYASDCEVYNNWLIQPFCGSRLKNNDFKIEIYDTSDFSGNTLFPIISGTLREEGDSMSWLFVRDNGLWQQPISMN